LWEFGNHAVQSDLMSVYAAQFVHDLNGDGCPEVLAVHGGDELSDPGQPSLTLLSAHLASIDVVVF
jgi:hypothetical protein